MLRSPPGPLHSRPEEFRQPLTTLGMAVGRRPRHLDRTRRRPRAPGPARHARSLDRGRYLRPGFEARDLETFRRLHRGGRQPRRALLQRAHGVRVKVMPPDGLEFIVDPGHDLLRQPSRPRSAGPGADREPPVWPTPDVPGELPLLADSVPANPGFGQRRRRADFAAKNGGVVPCARRSAGQRNFPIEYDDDFSALRDRLTASGTHRLCGGRGRRAVPVGGASYGAERLFQDGSGLGPAGARPDPPTPTDRGNCEYRPGRRSRRVTGSRAGPRRPGGSA